jgi:dihydrofolate reductase
MEHLTAIVTVNQDGIIGCGNAQPWRLRSQLRFFREQTLDGIVLVGRTTFDSLGHGRLPRRYNIVITHRGDGFGENEDCCSAAGIEDGLRRAAKAPPGYGSCFLIGGASLYEQYADYVDRYLITLVDKDVPEGDRFFSQEPFGDPDEWEINPLFSGLASAEDEADFSVFEILSRRPEMFRQRRLQLLAPPVPAKVATLRPKPRRHGRRIAARIAQASA